jgi:hypothetical protein
MFTTVTPQQRQAAYALSQQSWWPTLRTMLEGELAEVFTLLSDATPTAVGQLQGRAKAIREWIDLVANAGEVIAKAERRLLSGRSGYSLG